MYKLFYIISIFCSLLSGVCLAIIMSGKSLYVIPGMGLIILSLFFWLLGMRFQKKYD
jgi:hypothetical protein